MIFAYAGRRSPAFDADAVELVGERLRKLLTLSEPSAVVGAAACGADLLVLEEALQLNFRREAPDLHIVLPTPAAQFREESVEPDWRGRFDDVLAEVRERGTFVDGAGAGADPYQSGNDAILRAAMKLAAERGERAVALVIAEDGEGEYVEQFVRRAKLRDVRELRIDPTVRRAQRRRCFVVMPYHEKWDPYRSFKMNCDLTYGRLLVPALEHAQLDYRRADETVDPGVVLRPMIDDIAHADVVIADLATGNFNVGWELGLRHLLRDASTILIKPAGNVPTPFDVSSLRTVSYDHDEDGFGDAAVIEAWDALAPLLEPGAGYGQDSPVGATMQMRFAQIEPLEGQRLGGLLAQLANARDLASVEALERVVAQAGDLDGPAYRLVLAEAGTTMRRLGEHARARELLEPIVEHDPTVRLPAAHHELAMALYRRVGATEADFLRAEEILARVRDSGGYPETDSLLGAVAKRRTRELRGDARAAALRRARDAYRADYQRNLNDFYAGVNVLALHAVLGDHDEVTRLAPAVAVAVDLRLRHKPDDFWARASAAELELLTFLAGITDSPAGFEAAYRHAADADPLPDWRRSAIDQLEWYAEMGLPREPLDRAAAALGE